MANITSPIYRRDYTGETLTHATNDLVTAVFATPRKLPFDLPIKTSIVVGNGISRNSAEVQLLLKINRNKPVEGYKMTYACNAAFRDTPADYYVIKNNIFFSEISPDQYNKMFTPNNIWVNYRDTNLLPYSYHMDSGTSAAFLAAFDGATKIFLFGFDGTDGAVNKNVYENTSGYSDQTILPDYQKFNSYLYSVINAYRGTTFYRVRTSDSNDFSPLLKTLPNYIEVNVRDAILLGDF